MPDTYQAYYAFISSPGDVHAERQMAEEAILNINRTCHETLKLSLEIMMWENFPPETPPPKEKIQDIINKAVEKSHFFILVLYKRYGKVEPGHTVSNTEREINTILKRFSENPQLKILAYFRDIRPNDDPGEQENKVKDFKKRLQKMSVMYKTYKIPEEFKEVLTHDLYNVILRMRLSPYKQQALQRFWKFGEVDRPTHPRVALLYPPVNRQFMDFHGDKDFWFKRLHPNVYFEDYKALQKIQRTFMLIGLHDYRVYLHTDAPADLHFMNRVWVCFPRSRRALESLGSYKPALRFHSELRRKQSAKIDWKTIDGKWIEIESPLALYFKEQRSKMNTSGEWHAQLGKILCKDYAIVARFSDFKSKDLTIEGTLHDYYFAGIRGLGTWGAAWYLDRKYKHLLSFKENEDIQILLEVTYRDGRIYDIRDVTNEPEEYFKEQNKIKTIRNNIRLYLDS